MTTLAVDTPRVFEIGERNDLPVIAADILYEGSAVGLVAATGHARPLTSVDRFVGFVEKQADNSTGAAAAINVRVVKKGCVKLSVSGAAITDVKQPVYATDDNVFVFTPVGSVFIGFVRRWESSGVVLVDFDVDQLKDPWDGWFREALSAATLTADVQDSSKLFCVSVDSVITLPATAVAISCGFLNIGPFGTVQISISPDANDKVMGPNIAGADNKDLINTKATARRGDFATIRLGHADGPFVTSMLGTWAQEG